jgi:2-phosphoglycerate kinase
MAHGVDHLCWRGGQQDRLKGASNFLPWKARIMFLLRENGLWSHANTAMIASTGPAKLVKHEVKEAKAMWMILDLVRDHLVPHLSEKKSANAMFSNLTNLFQSNNENQKMVLRDRLRNTKKSKTDSVISYLTRITQVCDQLGVVGETMTDVELVRVALNGFTKPWTSFIKGICA